jgi:hypothetical protein
VVVPVGTLRLFGGQVSLWFAHVGPTTSKYPPAKHPDTNASRIPSRAPQEFFRSQYLGAVTSSLVAVVSAGTAAVGG